MPNFNVPYIVGNTFKRDHQYWPTKTREELWDLYSITSDTQKRNLELTYPIALNRKQLQVLMWKVREWTVAASTFETIRVQRDEPVVEPINNLAIMTVNGTTPEFNFKIRRYLRSPSTDVRDLTDERDILGEWRNRPQVADYYYPPGPFDPIPIWKTLRNMGVSRGLDDPDYAQAPSAGISFSWAWSESDWTCDGGTCPAHTGDYNHTVFGEDGASTGGQLIFFMLYDYVIYDPDADTFYPQIFIQCQLPTLMPNGRTGVFLNTVPVTRIVAPEYPDIPVGTLTVDLADSGADNFTIPIALVGINPARLTGSFIAGAWSAANTASGTFNLALNATAFWPFLNKQGELLFDGTSGAPTGADPFA